MGGLVLDILVEFIVRVIIRFFRARGAESWPVIQAEVTSKGYRGGFGCDVADINYQYRLDGELYTGADANPFLSRRSAKDYLEGFQPGTRLPVRVKPGRPGVAVLRQMDLYLQAHGYKLEAK
jgi:hypothetical protein